MKFEGTYFIIRRQPDREVLTEVVREGDRALLPVTDEEWLEGLHQAIAK